MLKVCAVLVLGAVALPSYAHDSPTGNPMSLEPRALDLGFRADLVDELAGRTCECACEFVDSTFPVIETDCNSSATSLTETVACGSGSSTCTISGNMTWAPNCGPPCCPSGTSRWLDGSNGSFAFFTDTVTSSASATFSGCTPGNLSPPSFQTACDAPYLIASATIKDCTGNTLTFLGVSWSALKLYSCTTVAR